MAKTLNNDKPTVVVVNGTADEGYWAVNYLLKTGRFNVRTTARRLDGDRLDRLRQLGDDEHRVEIVQAATDDQDALEKAFDKASGIYATSIYNIHAKTYRPANPEEMSQCRAVVGAARSCSSLEHFVWQTMARFDLSPESIGLESPIHFRTKWHWEKLIEKADLPWTYLRQPAYMRQVKFGMQYGDRLVYPYAPDARLSFVAEEDIGKFVAAIFSDRERHLHKAINGVTEIVSPVEIAARAHALNPEFSADYRQANFLENAFFDQVIARLKPAYRYPAQINSNLKAGNYFSMTYEDKVLCESLIAPLKLTTLEDWLTVRFERMRSHLTR
jgi:uncharacterized protein YbjT (DUF2867 family)